MDEEQQTLAYIDNCNQPVHESETTVKDITPPIIYEVLGMVLGYENLFELEPKNFSLQIY